MNRFAIATAVVLMSASAPASAQSAATPASRGELLYSTHCVSCHTAQVHWRDRKLASDWASLQAQVRRWQSNAGLAWSNADIAEVSRYLNRRHYRFKEAATEVSQAGAGRDTAASGPRAAVPHRQDPGPGPQRGPAARPPPA